MAGQNPRRGKLATAGAAVAASTAQEVQPDPLRAAAGIAVQNGDRDIIPLPILIAIFAVVEIVIIYLMLPQFQREFTVWLARRAEAHGQYAASIAPLKRLIQAEQEESAKLKKSSQGTVNPSYPAELANSYLALKQYDEAIKYWTMAQENRNNVPTDDNGGKPEIGDFQTAIGVAYYFKGDLANSERYLKLGLAHSKTDKQANFYMGVIEFKRGDYRKATEYFKMVADDPSYKSQVRDYYKQIEQKVFGHIQ